MDTYVLLKIIRIAMIRSIRFFFQRRIRGWDDSELWGLDASLAKLILPRLKRFRKLTCSYPPELSFEEWCEILDKMIYTFKEVSKDSWPDVENQQKIDEGLELFRKWYYDLWW